MRLAIAIWDDNGNVMSCDTVTWSPQTSRFHVFVLFDNLRPVVRNHAYIDGASEVGWDERTVSDMYFRRACFEHVANSSRGWSGSSKHVSVEGDLPCEVGIDRRPEYPLPRVVHRKSVSELRDDEGENTNARQKLRATP